ncbi:hypothetical protein EIN_118150 [Entamoeba invadens IP1]|uniref:Replication termination factor 2 n=1 Tax=Entamoeba invadens IP1 TaxID=370355 RepID=L7FNP4_ENTIV|nr:hypothetical protein EIN_118150 [Entamoeba invadens IP1]ELP92241.1 hypothetical protein EIN_118150 [Entamoeba invadens IP1]|eukprot:XP_004259012.1 hypothetical protein EIN_118150 [Entamoeba invadens IP1]
MGCDGGTVARRDDHVKKVKEPKQIEDTQSSDRYTHCSLSQQPFKKKIVCDKVGRMYNKDAILKALIQKSIPKEMRYIAARKDVIDLNVSWSKNHIICPLKKIEFTPGHQFVALSCGCVISQSAYLELLAVKGTKCPICEDVLSEAIPLNRPFQEMLDTMQLYCNIYDHKFGKCETKEEIGEVVSHQPKLIASEAKNKIMKEKAGESYAQLFK